MTQTVLITGANGNVGSALVEHIDRLAGPYALRLADLETSEERSIELDITDPASCRSACTGVDTVVHLAGVASPDTPFDDVLPVNIVGTYNVFEAALEAGANRVIYASSAQAVEGYPLDVQVRTDMPVRPKNLYGVSKAFGEALAAYYAYQKGLEAVAIRIGAFESSDDWSQLDARDLSAWSEPEDLCSLIVQCIDADLSGTPFLIAHGTSDNRFKRLDLSDTKRLLGYSPKSDSFVAWNIDFAPDSEPRT